MSMPTCQRCGSAEEVRRFQFCCLDMEVVTITLLLCEGCGLGIGGVVSTAARNNDPLGDGHLEAIGIDPIALQRVLL